MLAGTARAIFLDRDGTLVHPRHYPSRPDDLILYDGITTPLADLQRAGFRLVVVTNQSGIARGYFTEDDLDRMHRHLAAQLAAAGVTIDAFYYCPHHPEGAIPELAIRCDCRKPQPGMLHQAANDLGIDLERSWLIGDILDDIEAGNRAGCRTVLVDLGTEPPPPVELRAPDAVARDTVHALRIVQASEGFDVTAERGYRPDRWAAAPIAAGDGSHA